MFSQISLYILSLGLAALIPGPGMTGLIFKTLSKDSKHALLMLFGLITGDLIYLFISIFGLSLIQQIHPHFLDYILFLSSLYLLYLAYQFWNYDNLNILNSSSNSAIKFKFSSYFDGLFITLSNPKSISFYLALLPAIFNLNLINQLQNMVIIVVITIITLLTAGGIYILFALKIKEKLKYPNKLKIILRITAILMMLLALKMISEISF